MGAMRGWTAKRLVDGAAYYPPEGPGLGAITLHEQRRPLEPVRKIVEHDLNRMLDVVLASVEIEEVEQLTTGEGEHAALFRSRGISKIDGTPMEYMHGFVFGDDTYDRFDAYCTDPKQFLSFRISVRDVVFAYRLGLGHLRRRRVLYTPPTNWQGISRNRVSEYYPLDYPKRFSKIIVGPAEPEVDAELISVLGLAFALADGFVVDREEDPVVVMSTFGLTGELRTIHGHIPRSTEPHATELKTVTFIDERFTYRMRLETTLLDSKAANEAFKAVYESASPVPHPVARESDLWIAWDKAPV